MAGKALAKHRLMWAGVACLVIGLLCVALFFIVPGIHIVVSWAAIIFILVGLLLLDIIR